METLLKLAVYLLLCATLVTSKNSVESLDTENVLWAQVEEQIDQQRIEINLREVILLFSDLKVHISQDHLKNVSEIANAFQDDISSLYDRRSIREGVLMENNEVVVPNKERLPAILKLFNQSMEKLPAKCKKFEASVVDAISRVLHFYDNQLDEIKKGDTALALMFLKGVDDKHGQVLQETFPLGEWIQTVCENTRTSDDGDYCHSLARQWKNRSGNDKTNMEHWKPISILQKRVTEMDEKMLEKIGEEKDGIWGQLNGQCQLALVNRCEIPYVCERTLLDPTPRSQYLLTHQLLQRMLVETVDCPSIKSFVTEEETYTNLCTKMYLEAKYLDILDVPIVYRDLFAEMIGLCGHMGYTNFLREDWLNRILSWQSKSDSGCFVRDPMSPVGVLSTDIGFQRRVTQKELDQGIQQSTEKCLPHLTSVGLMALTAHYDYMMTFHTN